MNGFIPSAEPQSGSAPGDSSAGGHTCSALFATAPGLARCGLSSDTELDPSPTCSSCSSVHRPHPAGPHMAHPAKLNRRTDRGGRDPERLFEQVMRIGLDLPRSTSGAAATWPSGEGCPGLWAHPPLPVQCLSLQCPSCRAPLQPSRPPQGSCS